MSSPRGVLSVPGRRSCFGGSLRPCFCSGSTAVKNRGFVTQTTAAGSATGSPVIDLQTLSVNRYNSLHFCPNNGDYTTGPLGAFFCNDHTHFETYGARQIAGLVAGALRSQNIPLAAYLK
jgi:hypothetical protein